MRTVIHVMRLAEALSGGEPRGVSELARALDIDKSAAHRILRTLLGGGWVRQDEATRRYSLGPSLAALAESSDRYDHLLRVAIPILDDLGRDIDETIFLSVRRGLRNIVAYVRESSQEVRVASQIGRAIPLHCGAAGKVLLAFGHPALLEDLLAAPLRRYTANTIVDPEALRAELALTRRRGWGYENEEYSPGVRGIAAPVAGLGAQVSATLALRAPTSRLSPEDAARLAPELIATAATISAILAP